MIWFLTLIVVLNDGTAHSLLRTSTSPDYNNEQSCNTAGELTVNELTTTLNGTGKAYFTCKGISVEELKKALVSGQGL